MPELFSGLHVQSWWRSPSGLILPCSIRDRIVPSRPPEQRPRYGGLLWAERRNLLPNIAAYATPEALELEPLPFEAFCEMLAEIPQNVLLPVLSSLQARLFALEHNEEKELQLAELLFGKGRRAEAAEGVRHKRRGPTHRLQRAGPDLAAMAGDRLLQRRGGRRDQPRLGGRGPAQCPGGDELSGGGGRRRR